MVLIPVKQLNPQFLLQFNQLLVQTGLRDEKGFGCFGYISLVSNGYNVFQLP